MVTIPASERRTRYSPVVATTNFPVLDIDGNAAAVFDVDDIAVYKDGARLSTGYSVTATFSEGVSVNAVVVADAPGWTGTIDVVCDRSPNRTDQFVDGRGVPARDINLAMNRLSAESRENYDGIARAAKAPFGEAGPVLERGATGDALVQNGDGDFVAMPLSDIGSLLIAATEYMRAGLQAWTSRAAISAALGLAALSLADAGKAPFVNAAGTAYEHAKLWRRVVDIADGAEIADEIANLSGPLLVRLARGGTYAITKQIPLTDGSKLDLNRAVVTLAASAAHVVHMGTNTSGVDVGNGKIIIGRYTAASPNRGYLYTLNANGSGLPADSEAAVIYGEGITDFRIHDLVIEGINARAISLRSSGTQAVANGEISGVLGHKPQDNGGTAYGPNNFILVRSGPWNYGAGAIQTLFRPSRVKIVDCELWGIDRDAFDATNPAAAIDVYTHTNVRSADLCVIQSGEDCLMQNVRCYYSGEVGMDFTRGSRRCQAIKCEAKYNNRDGAFIGGGFAAIRLSEAHAASGFAGGNTVTGGSSATTGEIETAGVFADGAGNWWIVMANTAGNSFWQVGETATNGSGASGTVLEIVYAAAHCRVRGGAFNDNFHDTGGGGGGNGASIKFQRAYCCECQGVDLGNYEGVSVATAGNLYVASSPKFGYRGNSYGGSATPIIIAGADTTERFFDTDFFVPKKTTTTRSAVATPAADPELAFGMVPGATYLVTAIVLYNSGTTPGFRYRFGTVGGSDVSAFKTRASTGAADFAYSTSQTDASGAAAATDRYLELTARFTCPASATNISLEWAQNVSDAGNTQVRKGSAMMIKRVA